ncbi:predicted protein [Uncinocarpus reesii 1704]|uniref:Aminoglycoside phosphotransferase domain-containing protein n=1 Tax=Uncinocarpus reesii (strain UAMH 1704) TaxID=336963 RepID=C4JUM7_UNCRE|nr:uncharacterized protein UREG_04830 [Uncinocarpus reesii 1704]EEP79988.1 predicted protein [Uncinocarpus reesii 1704]
MPPQSPAGKCTLDGSSKPPQTPQKTDKPARTKASIIGSDSWTSAREYKPGAGEPLNPKKDERHFLYQRAVDFNDKTDWHAVVATASRLRNGKNCSIRRRFSIGIFNMVKRIVFEDGVSWVIRLRMPSLGGMLGRKERLPPGQALGMEVAAMIFFKTKTSIPVPKLYHYDLDPNNDIGAPYMMMEYIHDMGKGPWTTTTDYYRDFSNHCMETTAMADARLASEDSFINPVLFNYVLHTVEDPKRRNGPFYLTNYDFGPHNVLVNEKFEILAVIDFDSVIAAPLEVAAQLPFMAYLDLGPPPGLADSASEGSSSAKTSFLEYKRMIKTAEDKLNDGRGRDGLLSDAVFSKAAILFGGIAACGCHSSSVNSSWLRTYISVIRNDVISAISPTENPS